MFQVFILCVVEYSEFVQVYVFGFVGEDYCSVVVFVDIGMQQFGFFEVVWYQSVVEVGFDQVFQSWQVEFVLGGGVQYFFIFVYQCV